MYLKELFHKYSEWKIITYFLQNPEQEIHVKELSRKLKVSPGTASKTLNKAAEDDLLSKKVIGNVHLYSLNKESEQVKNLRKVVSEL